MPNQSYSDGTLSVPTGTAVVTGVGTAWQTQVKAGDSVHAAIPRGVSPEQYDWAVVGWVASVDSDLQLTLQDDYEGDAIVTLGYRIVRGIGWLSGAEPNDLLVTMLNRLVGLGLAGVSNGAPAANEGFENEIRVDATSRILYQRRGGSWHVVQTVGVSLNPAGPWVGEPVEKFALTIEGSPAEVPIDYADGIPDDDDVRHFYLLVDQPSNIAAPAGIEVDDVLDILIEISGGPHVVTMDAAFGGGAEDLIRTEDGARTRLRVTASSIVGSPGVLDDATTEIFKFALNDKVEDRGYLYVSNHDENDSEPQLDGGGDPVSTAAWTWEPTAVGADGAPGSSDVVGTSTSSVAIGTGSKAFTVVESDRGWGIGARLRVSSDADGANFMEGVITAYSGTALTILVDLVGGSGTLDDWTINLAGEPGETGDVSASANIADNAMLVGDGGAKGVKAHASGAPGDAAFKNTGTGAGAVAAGDHNHGGTYEPADSTILKAADISNDAKAFISYAPAAPGSDPTVAPYFNVIFGYGAKDDGDIWRSTFIGAQAATAFDEAERTEAIGGGAMRFAKYGDRCTAIGSLSMQWLGEETAELAALSHDLWSPTLPSDGGWDAFGLETRNPGVRSDVANATDAAARTDVQGNVGVGRNSGLHLINGTYNTWIGYSAGAHAYVCSLNAGVGYGALRDNLFGLRNVALGALAGLEHQEGDGNIYIGYQAGQDHVVADQSVMIGEGAGLAWTSGDRSVLIGPEAGQGVTPASDILVVQNDAARDPLLVGDFATPRLGMDCQPSDLATAYHANILAVLGDVQYSVVDSWTHSSDVASVLFQDLIYDDIIVVLALVTAGGATNRQIEFSADNGSNFLTAIATNTGAALAASALISSANAGARSSTLRIIGFNRTTAVKPVIVGDLGNVQTAVAVVTASALNALRISNLSGDDLTGGSIYILARDGPQ